MRAGVKASAVVASSATYAVTLFIGKKLKIRFGPPLLVRVRRRLVGSPTSKPKIGKKSAFARDSILVLDETETGNFSLLGSPVASDSTSHALFKLPVYMSNICASILFPQ